VSESTHQTAWVQDARVRGWRWPTPWIDRFATLPAWTLPSLLLYASALAFWWFVGIPGVGTWVASSMPRSWKEEIGANIMRTSRLFTQNTYLDPGVRTRIEDRVVAMAKTAGLSVQVTFVAGKPQAWAVPGGTVVFSDDLVRLLTDEEVDAIAAHELGHVRYEHGLRNMAQSTALLLLLTGTGGAESGQAGQVVAKTATVFQHLSHSRRSERQADAFAVELLLKTGRSPLALASAFQKITHTQRDEEGDEADAAEQDGYYSTHPPTAERIAAAQAAASAASGASR
jgi:Zn-dependent protease with chaperone function